MKDATAQHYPLIAIAMVMVLPVAGFLPKRIAGQENTNKAARAAESTGSLETLLLSERRQRQLADSRLHALQIHASLRHWNDGITWAAWDVLDRTNPKLRHFEYRWLRTLYNWGHTTVATGHYIHDIAWSPNGKHIAASMQDNSISLWDAKNLQPLKTLIGHNSAVRCASFNHDGTQVVSGDRRGGLKIWDVESGKATGNLTGHTELINSVEFSLDGERIVSASSDGTARVWDAESGKEIKVFRGHARRNVFQATFSPDGQWVASGGHMLRIWNSETGAQRHAIETSAAQVQAVAFSPMGDRVVTGHGARSQTFVQLWDVESGEVVHSYPGFQHRVETVKFAPDGRSFAAGGYADGLRICSAETGEEIRQLKLRNQFITSVAFAPGGNRLVAASPAEFRVWELDTPQTPITLQSTIGPSFSPDGKWVATTNGNHINLRNPNTGKILKTLDGHRERVMHMAFSPDGHHVASANDNGTIRVWDVEASTTLRTIRRDDVKMQSVSWSPQGNWLVSYGARRHWIWDAKTGELIADRPATTTIATSRTGFAFSHDDLHFVCNDLDHSINIHEVRTGLKRTKLAGNNKHLNGLAWSPNGILIAGSFSWPWAHGELLKVWEAQSGEELFAIKGQSQGWIPRVVFSPDGSRVMMAMGRNIRSWDARTGKELHNMDGHTSNVAVAEYFPDGGRIVSGGADGRIKIWNALVGEELLSLDIGETTHVSVNHDGTRLLSVARGPTRNGGQRESSHSVKLWHADNWNQKSPE